MIEMNDLQLSSDDRSSVQSHLDELSRKITSVVILVIILSIIWSFSIDQILNYVLNKLDPCENSCINIFSPDEWAGTRWLSAALIGLFTAAPYAMVQAYSFARPGLLPSERRGFVLWMAIMWTLSFIALVLSVTKFLPWLYTYGHSFNEGTGLTGKYDAAQMLRISISIAWTIILVLAAITVITIAGLSKLLWSGNSNWWRLRVHGVMLMLIWLANPSNLPGLMFTLTITASGLVEIFGWRIFRAKMPLAYGLQELYDKDGGIHRVLYADCRCCGVSPRITPLNGMGLIEFDSVCRDDVQQNKLLDSVKRFGATKVVFSGCSITSMEPSFIDSLRFLGCKTESLGLSYLSTIRTDKSNVDCDLAMASIQSPWSEESANNRCVNRIIESNLETIYYGGKIPFGLNLAPKEAWIRNPPDSLLTKIDEIGVKTEQISN